MHLQTHKVLPEWVQLLQLFLVDERGIRIPLKAGHHRPASETPNIEYWLGSFVIVHGIRTIAKNAFSFLFFQGEGVWVIRSPPEKGGGGSATPSGSAHDVSSIFMCILVSHFFVS